MFTSPLCRRLLAVTVGIVIVLIVVMQIRLHYIKKLVVPRVMEGGGKHYVVVHHFESDDTKEALMAYSKKHKASITKLMSGKHATCYFTLVSKQGLHQMCYWVADNEDSIHTQLATLEKYWNHSNVDETYPLYAFHNALM